MLPSGEVTVVFEVHRVLCLRKRLAISGGVHGEVIDGIRRLRMERLVTVAGSPHGGVMSCSARICTAVHAAARFWKFVPACCCSAACTLVGAHNLRSPTRHYTLRYELADFRTNFVNADGCAIERSFRQ